ncbi:MAG: nucleoside hydrolase [Patescibacteria group bacterium]|nr:nucleoside hydrolase [Patescibacteria group bacterium]
METILIDTDPGVDDSIALATACAAGMPVTGIATVFGNAGIDDTTRNACTILEVMKSDIPVYRGAARPLAGEPVLPVSHGENGMGGFRLAKLRKKPEVESAIAWYLRTLESATVPVTVVCLGPVTNIALVSILRPDLADRIGELVILGGVFRGGGNMTPVAEFNTLNDPLALAHAVSLRCPRTIIPLEVCRKVLFTKQDFDVVMNRRLRETFTRITGVFIRYYTSDDEYAGFAGAVMYDLLAMAYLLESELFRFDDADVAVETTSPLTRGQTIRLPTRENPCRIATFVDADGVKQVFRDAVNRV